MLIRTIIIIFLLFPLSLFSEPLPNKTDGLLWNAFEESKSFFSNVKDYSCQIQKNTFPKMETIYVAPAHFYLKFKDDLNTDQEFIFIDGLEYRQFIYPKKYKISGNGSLMYNGLTISIPDTSLDFFYNTIIHICEKNKDALQWSITKTDTTGDMASTEFKIVFDKPISIEDKPVKTIILSLDKTNSLPLSISLFDTGKNVVDSIKYFNLQTNTGLADGFFEGKISQKKTDEKVIFEDIKKWDIASLEDHDKRILFAKNIAHTALLRFSNIDDYSTNFIRKERVKNKLQKQERFFIKFRKPFDLYMKWLDKPNKGWELIYARGKYNNKVIVHVTGLANIFLPTLELDPTGSIAMMNNRHSIVEFGLGYVIENYYRDVKNSAEKNELTVNYIREENLDGVACWVVETQVPIKSRNYYCDKAIVYFDKKLIIPIKTIFYKWDAIKNKYLLIEKYTYKSLSFNNNFTDEDFDRNNKKYDF